MKGMQILNFMGRSNPRVLVHKHMETMEIKETIDIVLTPQFYTFIREMLAINFAYQAKNIAPALFDDYLDTNKSYQYHVYKCGEDWCFFAYDIEEISSFLQSRGIEPYLINKIYFAQELVTYLNKPIHLSDQEALYSIDQTVTVLPQRLLPTDINYAPINMDDVVLKNGVSISSSFDAVIPLKQTIFITVLLLILGGIFILEGERIKDSIANQIATKERLLSKNPKLASSLIRNSQLEKYQPINDQERLKRDTVMMISKMLSNKSQLKNLTLDEKGITVTITTKNDMMKKQLIDQAKKEKFKIVSQEKRQIVLEKKL